MEEHKVELNALDRVTNCDALYYVVRLCNQKTLNKILGKSIRINKALQIINLSFIQIWIYYFREKCSYVESL